MSHDRLPEENAEFKATVAEIDELIKPYNVIDEGRKTLNGVFTNLRLSWQELKKSPTIASQGKRSQFVVAQETLSSANEILIKTKESLDRLIETSKKIQAEIEACNLILTQGKNSESGSLHEERDALLQNLQQVKLTLMDVLPDYQKDCSTYIVTSYSVLQNVNQNIKDDLLAALKKAKDLSDNLVLLEKRIDAMKVEIKNDPACFPKKSRKNLEEKLEKISGSLDIELTKLFAIPKIQSSSRDEVITYKSILANFRNIGKITAQIDPAAVATIQSQLHDVSRTVNNEKKPHELFNKLQSVFLDRLTDEKKIREIKILFEHCAAASENNMDKLDKLIDALAGRKAGMSLFKDTGPKIKATTIELFKILDPAYDPKSRKIDKIKDWLKQPGSVNEALNNLDTSRLDIRKKASH